MQVHKQRASSLEVLAAASDMWLRLLILGLQLMLKANSALSVFRVNDVGTTVIAMVALWLSPQPTYVVIVSRTACALQQTVASSKTQPFTSLPLF
jgi:hypothetical protein